MGIPRYGRSRVAMTGLSRTPFLDTATTENTQVYVRRYATHALGCASDLLVRRSLSRVLWVAGIRDRRKVQNWAGDEPRARAPHRVAGVDCAACFRLLARSRALGNLCIS